MDKLHHITRKTAFWKKLTSGLSLYCLFLQTEVFERIIHTQMTQHFESVFHDFMFSYRTHHDCPTALLTLTEHWREELDIHKLIGAVVIDLSKAFDCLPHELILEKLKFYGLDDSSISFLRRYLSDRYYSCRRRRAWVSAPSFFLFFCVPMV